MKRELLLNFCKAVRNSTLKRLVLVPNGFENWKISTGALGFAEITKHIIDCDNWLLYKINNPDIKSIETESAIIKNCSRQKYEELITNLENVLLKKIEFINNLSDEQLSENIYDDRFKSEVSIAWIILRGNIDHEIHHRGQIATYLRVLKDKNIIM